MLQQASQGQDGNRKQCCLTTPILSHGLLCRVDVAGREVRRFLYIGKSACDTTLCDLSTSRSHPVSGGSVQILLLLLLLLLVLYSRYRSYKVLEPYAE